MGEHTRLIRLKSAFPEENTIEQNVKLKLFISYSHQDNLPNKQHIEEFKKHLAPLKSNGLIEEWYDCEVLPGEDFKKKIDNNLENADIICLFVSADFLNSQSCADEKKKAMELSKSKGVPVVPIILSQCGWLDDKAISKPLALPNDGKPVSDFENKDHAWLLRACWKRLPARARKVQASILLRVLLSR